VLVLINFTLYTIISYNIIMIISYSTCKNIFDKLFPWKKNMRISVVSIPIALLNNQR